MTETNTRDSKERRRGGSTRALLALALLIILVVLAIEQLQPPRVVPASAPPADFSAARALEHLTAIAQKPHPTGSPENARVREYLVSRLQALGLDPQVQTATVTRYEPRYHGPARAAVVNNVVARLKGTDNTRAVMLAAHYDSVSSGPGASDDGSGTVTVLETARALKAGPPLRNDVILLITDGEELGLMGAKAFTDDHPWAKDVGLVLNFEARGACGPSFMFETSARNGWLIREFARAAPYPAASSFTYDAYKRMPNDTDLTIFKRAGLAGLNFAYVGCWPRYHTVGDSVENLDPRSLQHDGSYALAVARHFGNLDLRQALAPDVVYFQVFHFTFHYPQTWALPLAVLALVLYLGALVLGLRLQQLIGRGLALGFLAWLVGTVLAAGLCQALWLLLRRTRLVALLPYGSAYNGDLYAYSFIALTVALLAALYAFLEDKTAALNLILGTLGWWALLTLLTTVYLPGASYLFVWPLLASLLGLLYILTRESPDASQEQVWIWAIPAAVGVLLFGPLPYLLVLLAGVTAPFVLAFTAALLAGFLLPLLHVLAAWRRGLVAGAALAVTVALGMAAAATSGYDAAHPRADSVAYVLNEDSGKALWVSGDKAPDAWTAQFLSGVARQGNLNEIFPFKAPMLEHEAPAAPLPPPEVKAADDVTIGKQRILRFLIRSPRPARRFWLLVQGAKVLAANANGKEVSPEAVLEGTWTLAFAAPPAEGVLLTLTVPAANAPTLKVVEESEGFPDLPGLTLRPRSEGFMPSPAFPDSVTLVVKTFEHFEMAHTMGH